MRTKTKHKSKERRPTFTWTDRLEDGLKTINLEGKNNRIQKKKTEEIDNFEENIL